jgi:type VI protein secretion system component Hcp
MAEMKFSPGDISALATKLDDLTGDFDERERALLVAIIGLARETVDTRAEGEMTGFASGQRGMTGIVVTKPTDGSFPTVGGALSSLSDGGDRPAESLSFNFTKIEVSYKSQ